MSPSVLWLVQQRFDVILFFFTFGIRVPSFRGMVLRCASVLRRKCMLGFRMYTDDSRVETWSCADNWEHHRCKSIVVPCAYIHIELNPA